MSHKKKIKCHHSVLEFSIQILILLLFNLKNFMPRFRVKANAPTFVE